MRNAPIRILILFAVVTVIGIIATQLYWIRIAIDQQDQVFNHNVHVALRNVVESLCEANGKDYPEVDPIEQVSPNYFVVRTNDQININDLDYLITAEIKKRAIIDDFDYGVYNCQNNQMVFAKNISIEKPNNDRALPKLENQEYYFGIYFPNRSRDLITSLDIWKFTAAVTIVVMVFFGYALFVILRQKRFGEMQRDFVNNVTHELKTPLATLSLAVNSLSGKPREKQERYLSILKSEIQKLQQNVNGILQASVIEANRKVIREKVDIAEFLNSLISDLRDQYVTHMITWDLTIKADTPLLTSKKVLETCIRNVVENAIKYGGKTVSVTVQQISNVTYISISDNGKGIVKEQLKHIFKKFYRVPSRGNQHDEEGFGLGLYLVRTSLHQIGGSISVSSTPGVGSTFTIKIPHG